MQLHINSPCVMPGRKLRDEVDARSRGADPSGATLAAAQVNAPPAHDTVNGRVRACLHDRSQFGLLLR